VLKPFRKSKRYDTNGRDEREDNSQYVIPVRNENYNVRNENYNVRNEINILRQEVYELRKLVMTK